MCSAPSTRMQDVHFLFFSSFLFFCWPTIAAVRVSQAREVELYEALCLSPCGRPLAWRLWERAEGILPMGEKGVRKKKSKGNLCGHGLGGYSVTGSTAPSHALRPAVRVAAASCVNGEKNPMKMYLALKFFPGFSPPGQEQLLKRYPIHLPRRTQFHKQVS